MKEIQVAEVVSPFYFSFEPRMVFQVLSGRWPALTSLRTFLFFFFPGRSGKLKAQLDLTTRPWRLLGERARSQIVSPVVRRNCPSCSSSREGSKNRRGRARKTSEARGA